MHSFVVDICIAAALALVVTVVLVYVGVSSFNKEAKEKGLMEKGYSVGSVVTGALVSFITLFVMIFYELFWKVR